MSFVTHVFWNYGILVQIYRHFIGMYSHQMQGRTPSAPSTLQIKTVRSSETSVNVYKITRSHTPESDNVHHHSLGPDSVVCIANRYELQDPGI